MLCYKSKEKPVQVPVSYSPRFEMPLSGYRDYNTKQGWHITCQVITS